MKKLTLKTFLLFITAIITFIPLSKTLAGQKTTIYFFWGQECPHCAKEKIFLEKLGEKYPELEIKSFEIYSNALSLELFRQTAQAYNIPVQGIPTTFIGEQVVTGFDNDETTGRKIENLIKKCISFGCPSPEQILKEQPAHQKSTDSQKTPLITLVFNFGIIIIVLFFLAFFASSYKNKNKESSS